MNHFVWLFFFFFLKTSERVQVQHRTANHFVSVPQRIKSREPQTKDALFFCTAIELPTYLVTVTKEENSNESEEARSLI